MNISPERKTKSFRPSSGPKALACYVCGRQTILSSYAIHTKQCKKLFEAREAQKPIKDRKSCPKEPEALQSFLNGNDSNQSRRSVSNLISDEIYSQLQKETTENAIAGLCKCEYCGRTFVEDKLAIHHKSCSAENPARRVNEPLTKREGGAAGAVTKNGTVRRSINLSKIKDTDDNDNNDVNGRVNNYENNGFEPSSPDDARQSAASRPRTAVVKTSTVKQKAPPRRANSARLRGEPFAWKRVHEGEEDDGDNEEDKTYNKTMNYNHGDVGMMIFDGKSKNIPIVHAGSNIVGDDLQIDIDTKEAIQMKQSNKTTNDKSETIDSTSTTQGNVMGSSIMKVLRSLSQPPSSMEGQEKGNYYQGGAIVAGDIDGGNEMIKEMKKTSLSDTQDSSTNSIASNTNQDGLNLLLKKVEGIESVLHQLTSAIREVKMEIMHQKMTP